MQKKSLLSLCAILSLFIGLLAFSSCSNKDKDNDPKPGTSEPTIVGVWDIEKVYSINKWHDDDTTIITNDTTLLNPGEGVYDFRADGKWIVSGSTVEHGEGSYELLADNKVKIINSSTNQTTIADIVELTDKKLTLYYEMEEDEHQTIYGTIYFNRE